MKTAHTIPNSLQVNPLIMKSGPAAITPQWKSGTFEFI